MLAGTVLAFIVLLNRVKNPYLRVSSIVIAMAAGTILAAFMGMIDTSRSADTAFIAIPLPMQYGLGFDWGLLIPLVIVFAITSLEAIGDITATSETSEQPVAGLCT